MPQWKQPWKATFVLFFLGGGGLRQRLFTFLCQYKLGLRDFHPVPNVCSDVKQGVIVKQYNFWFNLNLIFTRNSQIWLSSHMPYDEVRISGKAKGIQECISMRVFAAWIQGDQSDVNYQVEAFCWCAGFPSAVAFPPKVSGRVKISSAFPPCPYWTAATAASTLAPFAALLFATHRSYHFLVCLEPPLFTVIRFASFFALWSFLLEAVEVK